VTKFYIVDQSLVNRGGHHYDYTTCVAQAAGSMGFETIILANKNFDETNVFPKSQLRRPFHNTVYQRDSYLAGLRQLKRAKVDLVSPAALNSSKHSLWDQFKIGYRHQKIQRRRGKIINQFAKDCQRAFADVTFHETDHVFLTTVSELEMMGLAIFLRSTPTTIAATWHLQFHFNMFDGRTPEYAAQSAIQQMTGACFESSLNRLNYHNLHCYTTSQTLADQYNRLGVTDFKSLPYPVAREFAIATEADRAISASSAERQPHFANQQSNTAVKQNTRGTTRDFDSDLSPSKPISTKTDFPSAPSALTALTASPTAPTTSPGKSAAASRALRFTCPGQIRREKGCFEYLQPLVNELWQTHLATGKVKIALQRPRRKRLRKQKIELTLPRTDDTSALPEDAIEYFDHPLQRDAYIDFIKNTDCGLLFYDSRTYFSRRAGVLGELLSAGKPLIVSAGSWLAQQIAEPNFLYGESLVKKADSTRVLRIEDMEYEESNVPAAGGVVTFDQKHHPFKFSLNRQMQEQLLLFRFQWKFPTEEGTFVRISMTQKDGQGNTIDRTEKIVGHPTARQLPNCLFQIQCDTETIEFALHNAFAASTASLKNISIEALSMPAQHQTSTFPLSSVGIIAADASQLSSAVIEIERHYDHYKSSAEQFAQHWFARHNPLRTVANLIANQ
jgi:hypothetical protein